MAADSRFDDLGPGLHVRREPEPLSRAGALAAELRADLCATLTQADALLAERSTQPTVDAAGLASLELLARRLARAERIVARTRDRAVDEVGKRIALPGAALAVHPTTIRDRAGAVEAARRALAEAEAALAAHLAAREAAPSGPAPAPAAGETADADREPDELDPLSLPSRARQNRAIGAIVVASGVGIVLFAVRAVPLWAALLPTFLACLWALWYLKPRDVADEEYRIESSSLLAEVAAVTDEVFGARVHEHDTDREAVRLRSARDRAQEEVRVAERAWYELAGEGVDVTDVEEVVRRYDPQHEDAVLLAGETVGVRATEVVRHRFEQRWIAACRDLGLDPPPPTDAEAAVRELARTVTRPVVLVGPACERAEEIAATAPAAPVVALVGPDDAGPAAEADAPTADSGA